MGLLDKLPFGGSTAEGTDPGMTSRLDKVAKLSVEHVDIPTEFRPTDLEAWLFAPAGTRVGVLGEPSSGAQGSEKIPELVDLVKERFERLETALDLMEANLKLTQQQTAQLAAESISQASSSGGGGAQDVMHTVGDDGEVTGTQPDPVDALDQAVEVRAQVERVRFVHPRARTTEEKYMYGFETVHVWFRNRTCTL